MMEDKDTNPYEQEDQDSFGLPEVEYEPLSREEEDGYEDDVYQDQYEEEDDDESNNVGLIVGGIVSLLLVIGLCLYLFMFDGLDQISGWFADEPVPEPITEVVVEPEPQEIEPDPEPIVDDIPEIDPLAPYSEISTISQPTGRSYIVIGSFVDGDLAQDYGQELLDQGIGSRIIPPTPREPLMYRVAIADFDNFQTAMNDVIMFRDKYGDKTWVLKY